VVCLPLPTAASLLVVLLIAVAGFGIAGDLSTRSGRGSWWGEWAGTGGILPMPYLGMMARSMQATIVFDGVAVVSAALLLFFCFRGSWQRNNLALGLCSLLPGGAVCGVHYTGMLRVEIIDSASDDLTSLLGPNVLLAVTLSLASFSCLVALSLLSLQWALTLRGERERS
jgi:NO-binding membrane sensor protein with MHYT domain